MKRCPLQNQTAKNMGKQCEKRLNKGIHVKIFCFLFYLQLYYSVTSHRHGKSGQIELI
jgi:hypothetical protein